MECVCCFLALSPLLVLRFLALALLLHVCTADAALFDVRSLLSIHRLLGWLLLYIK